MTTKTVTLDEATWKEILRILTHEAKRMESLEKSLREVRVDEAAEQTVIWKKKAEAAVLALVGELEKPSSSQAEPLPVVCSFCGTMKATGAKLPAGIYDATLEVCAACLRTKGEAVWAVSTSGEDVVLRAIRAAIVHLEACERGQIHHPFKSASLPLLREALARLDRPPRAADRRSELLTSGTFVLTVYEDTGGTLGFHAGPEGDFERDVAGTNPMAVFRRFWIDGRIVKEEGP